MKYRVEKKTLLVDEKPVELEMPVDGVREFDGLLIVLMFPEGRTSRNICALNKDGERVWTVSLPVLPADTWSHFVYTEVDGNRLVGYHCIGNFFYINTVDGSIKEKDTGRPW